MTSIIEVKNLSKKYKIGEQQPYLTLRDSLANLAKNPFQKIKAGLSKDEFWALKDINFTVEQGEVLGIIGRNGAGKSTLLKILSRITPPTTGEIVLRGRVGSLLEVGTGFQQELTGRENIFLNGAILGMTQREIKRKFDEIVDFAEVEKFIDTPVKHYSSGMYMRLAFSIAAHLDSEILIVDEVLAVGDVEFQKKCLGKMDEISKKQKKTIIFVSHNMSALKKLCDRGIYLDKGVKESEGTIDELVSTYTNSSGIKANFKPIKIPEIDVVLKKLTINSQNKGKVYPGQPVNIDIKLESQRELQGMGIQVMISHDDTDGRVFSTNTKATQGIDIKIKKGINHFTCTINNFNLSSGKYRLGFGIDIPTVKSYYFNTDIIFFDVQEITFEHSLLPTSPIYSHVYLDHKWIIKK